MSAPIPERPEAITPELLSRAFAGRFPGANARAVHVVDAHSGTTGRARLRVDWKDAAGAPSAVFAKLAPTDPIQREMVVSTGMGKREARFYAEVASDVPVRVPAPYGAAWNDDGSAYWMLIEDTEESGCRFPKRSDPRVPDYAHLLMEDLARLHAAFESSPRLLEPDGDLAWIEAPMRGAIGPVMIQSAVEQFGSEMGPAFHEMARIYIEHNDAFCDRLDAGTPTLIHGDCHLGNLMVDARPDGERMGFFDWACTARAPGMRDVAYFLASNVETGFRRANEQALVREYLAALERCGANAPPFDGAWRQYRLYVVCGWIAATVTAAAGSRMQPLEIGMRSMERSTAALEDLESPALFREELSL